MKWGNGCACLQVAGEADCLTDPDEPLGRVILVPFDGISIIHWELMVEVVVAFTDSDKSSDDMVARGVLVVEGSVSEPVSE